MVDDSASRRKDAWSADQDRMILDLREKLFPWKEVAEQVRRSVEACCARYRVLVPADIRPKFRSSRQWSEESTTRLKQLLSEKRTVPQIAEAMGCARTCIYSKIQYMNEQQRKLHIELTSRVFVPPACLEDRARRFAAQRDITGEFFGDPPPGFSALDKKIGVFA